MLDHQPHGLRPGGLVVFLRHDANLPSHAHRTRREDVPANVLRLGGATTTHQAAPSLDLDSWDSIEEAGAEFGGQEVVAREQGGPSIVGVVHGHEKVPIGGQVEVPTTWPLTFLRHHPSTSNDQENNAVLRAERHLHVQRITGLTLPTAEEEQTDATTVAIYDAAIALLRPYANQQHLVSRENAHYGFWRNLYGLRMYVIITGAVGFAARACLPIV